jgi:hypothetical protein
MASSLRLSSGWRNRHPQDQDLCVSHPRKALTNWYLGAVNVHRPFAQAARVAAMARNSLSRAEKEFRTYLSNLRTDPR